MAKGKGKKKGKKKAKARKGSRKVHAKKAAELRKSLGLARARLHEKAAQAADFHGGKSPVRSGCGRPRKHSR